MKNIIWRNGKYKYRDALFAYVNQIRVAVVTPMHDGSRFDAHIMLPGLPKATNVFTSLDNAKGSLEQRINNWFELVKQ